MVMANDERRFLSEPCMLPMARSFHDGDGVDELAPLVIFAFL